MSREKGSLESRKPADSGRFPRAVKVAGVFVIAATIAGGFEPAFAQSSQQATVQDAQATQPQPSQPQPAQSAQGIQTHATDLTQTSVEDLLNVEVTSVSKNEQKLSRTAAAVFVITREDIARSGATNIPDLLRMVPGMNVAQVNQNTWAIAARGFNDVYSNELLVTVDGRIVYTPSFGGVMWDVLKMPLEDIDRIEVIRGSAGAIWGANAVNGIVNIITKKAGDAQGGLVVAASGSDANASGLLQYGGKARKSTDYRVYATYENVGTLPLPDQTNGGDAAHFDHVGFRADSQLTANDSLSVQGSLYQGVEGGPTNTLPSITGAIVSTNLLTPVSGGFLQGVWHHSSSDRFLMIAPITGIKSTRILQPCARISNRNSYGGIVKRSFGAWMYQTSIFIPTDHCCSLFRPRNAVSGWAVHSRRTRSL